MKGFQKQISTTYQIELRNPNYRINIQINNEQPQQSQRQNNISTKRDSLFLLFVFYFLVHMASIIIEIIYYGSTIVAYLWMGSIGILFYLMFFSYFRLNNSKYYSKSISIIFTIIFLLLEIMAFAISVQNLILQNNYIKPEYYANNQRILDEVSPSYNDCKIIKENYPKYYEQNQSNCDFIIMINERPNYGKQYWVFVDEEGEKPLIGEYELWIIRTTFILLGFILALILIFYFCKTLKNIWDFMSLRSLQHKIKQLKNEQASG